ncbi:hypothetical protein [Hoylesella buccalis]|uniref:Replication-associated protein ORF2/G2P domain-containing protein n=1 Tax=Hoylesella buccalis DNF00853 TaxID=1401074 RepID=A0A095ZJE0_9BACT|nr:hypothetical protein [Hoylesella buccalis]KGF34855.1 hypothetical protein HMPREF2137_05670 [Hoylesella buccalis DNF00853]
MIEPAHLKIVGNCLNPRKVYNPSLHGWMYCSCDKCTACLNQQATTLSNRVRAEIEQHKYSVFFTLTYDNEHLPKYEVFQDSNDVIQYHPIGRLVDDSSSDMLSNSCPLNKYDSYENVYQFDESTFVPPIENYENIYHFGVVSKKDVQNFLKRLRWRISKIPNITKDESKIRYYISSEYGPTTYRPHYHGVIFFDSKKILDKIKSLIVMSWGSFERLQGERNRFKFRPFARPALTADYIKLCDPNTAYYVASYVAGNAHLPEVLQLRETKPFHIQSKNPVIGSFKVDKQEILENINRGTYTVDKQIFDDKTGQFNTVSIPLPESTLSSIFRKCVGYSSLAYDAKLQLYSFYSIHFEEWKNHLTHDIYELIIQENNQDAMQVFDGFTSPNSLRVIHHYLHVYPHLKYRSFLRKFHSHEYNKLDMDNDANWYASKNAYKQTQVLNFTKFYQHEDVIVSYLCLFDKYLLLRKMYTLKNFYELQDDLIKAVGVKSALLHCYPTIYEDVQSANGYVKSYKFGESCNNVISYVQRYVSKHNLLMKPINKTFEQSLYYQSFVNQQEQRLLKSTKQKKFNNSYINNQRLIY